MFEYCWCDSGGGPAPRFWDDGGSFLPDCVCFWYGLGAASGPLAFCLINWH